MRIITAGLDMAVKAGVEARRAVLIGGDFNSEFAGSLPLVGWVQQAGLVNASLGAAGERGSFFPGVTRGGLIMGSFLT